MIEYLQWAIGTVLFVGGFMLYAYIDTTKTRFEKYEQREFKLIDQNGELIAENKRLREALENRNAPPK
jgi:hypothetical protein